MEEKIYSRGQDQGESGPDVEPGRTQERIRGHRAGRRAATAVSRRGSQIYKAE
ncbi:hypothetical protein PO909_007051 [Leuciscus waleckii]